MTDIVGPSSTHPGWVRNRSFDITFVRGVALIALLSGVIVVNRPDLLRAIILVDFFLLGYHHVIATFTRIAFDRQSLQKHRFLVFGLPFIVFGLTFLLAWSVGIWLIVSVYLYWQWFHYTRQSWGISQVYRGKSGGLVTDSPLFSKLTFYLLPLWGILHRSWQAPNEFLFSELRVIPVPEMLVDAVGIAAVASIVVWVYQRLRALQEGKLPVAHTWYMLSHFTIFTVSYLLIDDITSGWLVINIWHNAQYILFVWLFNTNRYKQGVDSKAHFLSTISQPRHIGRYMFFCFATGMLIYLPALFTTSSGLIAGLPMVIVFYQAINFHHYIVDSQIWKVRKKPMQVTLGIGPT